MSFPDDVHSPALLALLPRLADALEAAEFPQTAPHVRAGHGLRIHLPWVRGMLTFALSEVTTPETRQAAEHALALTDEALAAMEAP